jgi:ATP-dependent Clp protease ATP-binding subunit ClpC
VIELYTNRALQTLVLAHDEAAAAGSKRIETEHVLLALLRDAAMPVTDGRDAPPNEPESVAVAALETLGVDPRALEERLRARLSLQPTTSKPHMSRGGRRAVRQTLLEARLLGDSYVGTEHLLLGLMWVRRGTAARALAELGVDKRSVTRETIRSMGAPREPARRRAAELVERNPGFRASAAMLDPPQLPRFFRRRSRHGVAKV